MQDASCLTKLDVLHLIGMILMLSGIEFKNRIFFLIPFPLAPIIAMAYIKMKNWKLAEDDATSALKIDPTHYKSYQRRCVARLSMGKLRAAMQDACSAADEFREAPSTSTSAAHPALEEILNLQDKVEKALMDAVKRAPRRKIPITVAE